MPEGLKLVVDADTRKAEASLKEFTQEAARAGQVAGQNLAKGANIGTQAINRAGTTAKKTGKDFTSLSRVIQDLPFGFIAIQNNLTQLLPAAGALGLAFSGLIAALTFIQVGFSGWSRGSKQAKKDSEENKKAVDEAAEAQQKYKQALDAAASSVISQANSVNELGRILADTTNKVQVLTEKIVQQGVAQFLFNEKNEAIEKLLSNAINNRLKIQKDITKFKEREFKATEGIKQTTEPAVSVSPGQQQAALETFRRQSITRGLSDPKDLFKLEGEIEDINNLARDLGINFSQFLDKVKESKKHAKELKKDLDIPFARFSIRTVEDIQKQAGIVGPRTYEQVKKAFEDSIEKAAKNNPLVIDVVASVNAAIRKEDLQRSQLAQGLGLRIPGVNEAQSALTDIQKNTVAAANSINSVLTPAFQDLFSAIKNGEEPLKAFFQGIGAAIEQLIQKLIAAAVQALILSSLFPGGIGGVKGFGGFFKNILGFAQGGIVSGPTLAMIGEGSGTSRSNPEIVAPLDQLRSMIADTGGGSQTIVLNTRLRGNDISLVQSRTNRRNRRLGA